MATQNVFQGPVGLGGDVQRFRRTGSAFPQLQGAGPLQTGQSRSGQVLGLGTTSGGVGVGSTGAGGGGGQTQGAPTQLLEAVPDAPSFDDSGFQAAQAALGQAQGAAESGLSASRQAIEAARTRQLGELKAAQERQLGQFGQQRTREQARGESAIAEARRQAAELQQGLQARFGAATGTGAFAGELLGREALRNIAGTRQQLNQTLSGISQEEEFTRQETERQIRNVNEQSQAALQNAQAQFQQTLADIAGRRAETESARANARRIALQDFANLRADIEARNIAFQRDIAAQQEARQSQLQNFANRALQDFETAIEPLSTADFLRFQAQGGDVGTLPQGSIPGAFEGARFAEAVQEEDDDSIF